MKASDYLAKQLECFGVSNVFGVQGGAVVHIFDSIHRVSNIRVCYTHHEQSASLAAAANAKLSGNLGVCITTTGPAASNALTGLLAAWQDSTPVFFISGQTRLSQVSYGRNVRQRGSQECNILDVVKPWCKFSALIPSIKELPSILDKAYFTALSGRQGPVWLDFPVDIQWAEDEYIHPHKVDLCTESSFDQDQFSHVFQIFKESKRPLFVLGRVSYDKGLLNQFLNFLNLNNIPMVSTWGTPTISKDHCFSAGIIGVSGQPSANFAVRASDHVIFIGCHFSITQSGGNYAPLCDNQLITFVNSDIHELRCLSNPAKGFAINSDANAFIDCFINTSQKLLNQAEVSDWNNALQRMSHDLSPANASQVSTTIHYTNPHLFIICLYSRLNNHDIVSIDGGGCALYAGFQCIPSLASFNVVCSTSISAMGSGLPELCGGALVNDGDHLNICIIGDGSLMFNLQELQTIKTNLKSSIILVINNLGYLAIRHTQKDFLDSRYYGTSGGKYGLDIPSISGLAKAFNYEYINIDSNNDIESVIDDIVGAGLAGRHVIVDIMANPNHPNLYSASFLENKNGSLSQQDLHLMKPFQSYQYEEIIQNYQAKGS